MKRFKKAIALFMAVLILSAVALVSTGAVTDDTKDVSAAAATGITVHFKDDSTSIQPNIYYWNSLPQNIETSYPGPVMAKDASQGDNWYTYEFANKTKINVLFTVNGKQSEEVTMKASGEYWYKNGKLFSRHPEHIEDVNRTDMREDTIYFVMTTRFYDGNTGNNVHCWDDSKAGNPDSDPAWRGDFQGLIDKLDYIKALGFSAIWITPIVTNASGYDYHGYHAMDFSTVDVRYESQGATFEDLIYAVHEKDMKIVQDMVINHSGNFGEEYLAPMFDKVYDDVKDLEDISSMVIKPNSKLAAAFPDYENMLPADQYQARLAIMKNTDGQNHDTNNYYHHHKDLSWESPTVQTGQIAGDCVDINTENQVVANYLNDVYNGYINMGVDGFRMDTEKHVSRITLNQYFFPSWQKTGGENFYIFGEVCTRVSEFWNHGIPAISAPFYTWAETDSKYINALGSDQAKNVELTYAHYASNENTSSQPTSDNAFLKGNEYHTPDYSKSNRTGVIDFPMHWNFSNASNAFRRGVESDPYYNDSTWNVTYVDSHDYGPDMDQRYNGGTTAWAENLCLMFTFRGVPCVYYGSEVEFKNNVPMDVGPNAPLEDTGRAYFGNYLEGNVTASGFSQYTASGTVKQTLNSPLALHLSRLNLIRRAVPALQKGQYSTSNISGGEMAFKRGYTDPDTGKKSFALVSVTGGATFTNIPDGTYIDAVSGDTKIVSGGTLTVPASGKGNMRVYVLSSGGYTGISGKVTSSSITSDPYLK